MEDKKKTYGELIGEAQTSQQEEMLVRELSSQMLESWPRVMLEAIDKGKLTYPGEKQFFIECRTRKEKIHSKTLHPILIPRLSCPTPCHDQSVFRYLVKDDLLEYIWTVPDAVTCVVYKENRMDIEPSEWELLGYVMDFYSGELEKKARKFNNEEVIFDMALVQDDSLSEIQ
jgi:hypothetical protein